MIGYSNQDCTSQRDAKERIERIEFELKKN
jgi:hypothetical protein